MSFFRQDSLTVGVSPNRKVYTDGIAMFRIFYAIDAHQGL
jgi:hypothetical protein